MTEMEKILHSIMGDHAELLDRHAQHLEEGASELRAHAQTLRAMTATLEEGQDSDSENKAKAQNSVN